MGRNPLPDKDCRKLTINEAFEIKKLMRKLGRKSYELGDFLGLEPLYLSRKLCGKRGLTKEEARKIFEYLNRNEKLTFLSKYDPNIRNNADKSIEQDWRTKFLSLKGALEKLLEKYEV